MATKKEAIYHLQVRLGTRSDGHVAAQKIAYRTGTELTDDTLNITYNYENKRVKDGIENEMYLPKGASEKFKEYGYFAEQLEDVSTTNPRSGTRKRRADGRLYKEIELALFNDLTKEENKELTRRYINRLREENEDVAVLASFHKMDGQINDKSGKENPHVHIVVPYYRIEDDKLKKGQIDSIRKKSFVDKQRVAWKEIANGYFKEKEKKLFIDNRSHKERGIEKLPQDRMLSKYNSFGQENPDLVKERVREIKSHNKNVDMKYMISDEKERAKKAKQMLNIRKLEVINVLSLSDEEIEDKKRHLNVVRQGYTKGDEEYKTAKSSLRNSMTGEEFEQTFKEKLYDNEQQIEDRKTLSTAKKELSAYQNRGLSFLMNKDNPKQFFHDLQEKSEKEGIEYHKYIPQDVFEKKREELNQDLDLNKALKKQESHIKEIESNKRLSSDERKEQKRNVVDNYKGLLTPDQYKIMDPKQNVSDKDFAGKKELENNKNKMTAFDYEQSHRISSIDDPIEFHKEKHKFKVITGSEPNIATTTENYHKLDERQEIEFGVEERKINGQGLSPSDKLKDIQQNLKQQIQQERKQTKQELVQLNYKDNLHDLKANRYQIKDKRDKNKLYLKKSNNRISSLSYQKKNTSIFKFKERREIKEKLIKEKTRQKELKLDKKLYKIEYKNKNKEIKSLKQQKNKLDTKIRNSRIDEIFQDFKGKHQLRDVLKVETKVYRIDSYNKEEINKENEKKYKADRGKVKDLKRSGRVKKDNVEELKRSASSLVKSMKQEQKLNNKGLKKFKEINKTLNKDDKVIDFSKEKLKKKEKIQVKKVAKTRQNALERNIKIKDRSQKKNRGMSL